MDKKQEILVVDDDARNLQLLGNLLKTRYDLILASNGKQALSELEKSIPDLILLDVMMPALDGYKVCEMIKKNERTKDIPVIFLSAKSETADIIRGLKVGAADYALKPFNQVELLSRIHTQLELASLKKRVVQLESENFHLRRKLGEV